MKTHETFSFDVETSMKLKELSKVLEKPKSHILEELIKKKYSDKFG